MCQKLYKIQFYQWVRRNRGKRGKSVGKRVQHTPPTGTTLTEFRRFFNIDFETLRMNAKSTHTFAPLTKLGYRRLSKNGNSSALAMPPPRHYLLTAERSAAASGSPVFARPFRHPPDRHMRRASRLRTVLSCHAPPRAVQIRRSLRAAAMARGVAAPAA